MEISISNRLDIPTNWEDIFKFWKRASIKFGKIEPFNVSSIIVKDDVLSENYDVAYYLLQNDKVKTFEKRTKENNETLSSIGILGFLTKEDTFIKLLSKAKTEEEIAAVLICMSCRSMLFEYYNPFKSEAFSSCELGFTYQLIAILIIVAKVMQDKFDYDSKGLNDLVLFPPKFDYRKFNGKGSLRYTINYIYDMSKKIRNDFTLVMFRRNCLSS